MKLHVDHGQWGGGEEIPSLASAIQNHFSPDRYWSFHYTVFRSGGGGQCWRGKVADVGTANRSVVFMHELGHCSGLGHGGSTGPNTRHRSGTPAQQQSWGFEWVWYDQDAVSTNNAPNYLSVMSYSFNGIVWVPGTGFVFPHVHSEEALPALDENALDERASSAFVQALRSAKLPPGVPANGVRATMYSCLDPDDGNVYIMATDGHQLLARHRRGDPWPTWQLTNLPAQDALGVDWDCDGKIEASVSTNVNGCSGECFLDTVQDGWQPGQAVTKWTTGETLAGTADWKRIPALDPCPGDAAVGAGYLHSAHDPPCESNGWAPASVADDEESPWERLPPGEWCNASDDDGDGLVDEGCLDSDGDGVVDEGDNCPDVQNPGQEDRDQDLRGDACSLPPAPPGELTARRTASGVSLAWQSPATPGVAGYNVYRRAGAEADFAYLGALWPSTTQTGFEDTVAPGRSVAYRVRTVGADGRESEPAEASVAGCTGDCDGGGAVTVAELVLGVNIALGQAGVSACAAFDDNGSGTVTVDELFRGVGHALSGCPG